LCDAPRYGVTRKAAYRGHEKVIESRADDVPLGATVDGMAVGDRFGQLDASTIDSLRRAFVWEPTTQASTPSRFIQEQLEALGYH
jgi:hypothetical protein